SYKKSAEREIVFRKRSFYNGEERIGNCKTMFLKAPVVQNRQSPQGTLSLHCRSQRCIGRPNTASETQVHFQWTSGATAPCLRFVYSVQLLS
ncbi:MAG: hypothetical protein K2N98_02155, partial [Lachnospiraceae bacterium]|nr:hypothetical protein [Lachnospiraceae bacterium]